MGLNAEQQSAVFCETNCLVLAPPGSGKTGTLVEKTKHIISTIKGSVVVLCTFTDASAKEAEERLSHALSKEQMRRVRVATFHKHTMEQLRAAGRLGKILGPGESTEMLRQSLNEVGSTLDVRDAEAKIQKAKSTPAYLGNEEDFIEAYEKRKLSHRAIDLQDVIREAVKGMRSMDPARHVKPLPASHVLCDEFQDVDENQLQWLLAHHAAGAIVTAVGDDDQSVYSFRNSLGYVAMVSFIEAIKPRVIHLSVNYRSKSEILSAANELIQINPERMAKTVIANRGDGGSVKKISCPKKNDEACLIADEILLDAETLGVEKTQIPSGRWGIIGRNNADLFMISLALRKAGIPHTKPTKRDDTPRDIALFCSFLISIQTNDTLGLFNTLTHLGLSAKSQKILMARLGDDVYSIMDGHMPDLDEITIEEKASIKDFLKLSPNWRYMTYVGEYTRVIGAVSEFFLTSIVRGDDAKEDFKAFSDLLCGASTYAKKRADESSSEVRKMVYQAPKGDLKTRVMKLLLQDDQERKNAGVSLYTMHGSKGLEFDRVFVVQCNNGTVPSSKNPLVAEERRLFFVAMTRARLDLRMSYSPTKGESQFLREFTC